MSPTWDEAKAMDERNRQEARNRERDALLLAIGEMAVRSSARTIDCCMHCAATGEKGDPHDWDCPQPLIERFHEEGHELPTDSNGDDPR